MCFRRTEEKKRSFIKKAEKQLVRIYFKMNLEGQNERGYQSNRPYRQIGRYIK